MMNATMNNIVDPSTNVVINDTSNVITGKKMTSDISPDAELKEQLINAASDLVDVCISDTTNKSTTVSNPTNKLIAVIRLLLASDQSLTTYTVQLNPELIHMLSTLISEHKEYFVSIEDTFVEIVKDNKINASDVPNLILLILNLYALICSTKLNKSPIESCRVMLKFIFNVIVKEKIVKVDNEEELLTCLNTLVDSCIELVIFQKKTSSSGTNLFSCFGYGC